MESETAAPSRPLTETVNPAAISTDEYRARIDRLLKAVGDPAKCRGCNADIFWVTHRNGKKAPYTPAGLNHFADCEKAAGFKRASPAAAAPASNRFFLMNVAGTSFRRQEVNDVHHSATHGSPVTFDLIPEDANPHDANAVRVVAKGQSLPGSLHVGYVPRELCVKTRQSIAAQQIAAVTLEGFGVTGEGVPWLQLRVVGK